MCHKKIEPSRNEETNESLIIRGENDFINNLVDIHNNEISEESDNNDSGSDTDSSIDIDDSVVVDRNIHTENYSQDSASNITFNNDR